LMSRHKRWMHIAHEGFASNCMIRGGTMKAQTH
jgi:hypothetical protein